MSTLIDNIIDGVLIAPVINVIAISIIGLFKHPIPKQPREEILLSRRER